MKIVLSVAAGMVAGSYITLRQLAVLDDDGQIAKAVGWNLGGKFSKTMDNLFTGGRYQTPVNRPRTTSR